VAVVENGDLQLRAEQFAELVVVQVVREDVGAGGAG
jgi:hypothetical protein